MRKERFWLVQPFGTDEAIQEEGGNVSVSFYAKHPAIGEQIARETTFNTMNQSVNEWDVGSGF